MILARIQFSRRVEIVELGAVYLDLSGNQGPALLRFAELHDITPSTPGPLAQRERGEK
jgi:hypothetical protein